MKNISPISSLLLVYLTFLLITVTFSIHRGNETDKLSLLAFKAKVTNDPHKVVASWNDSLHFCQWWGVTCGKKHQRITRLDLPSRQLSGILSPHIGNLSFLKVLDLENNSFSGHIPVEVGRLSRLQKIYLNRNSFSGEIPRNISGCSNLLLLDFGFNFLVGRIPIELSSLSKLTFLSLQINSLMGELLPSLGNLSSLEVFSIIVNNFQGSIPYSFGNLKRLNSLHLTENNLSGQIPPSLFNLSSFKHFAAQDNQLQGSLPPDLGNLEFFDIAFNQLYGPIPASIFNASKLSVFSIGTNEFTGTLSAKFANLVSLQIMVLEVNNLTNDDNDMNFLSGLVNCTNLRLLSIMDNNFGGLLPEYISNFSTKLEKLALGGNQISGKIPTDIGNLINLDTLGMEFNKLTYTIPRSIGKLQNLHILLLNGNELSGEIPDSIGNLSKVALINLRVNNLEGSIPSSLGQTKKLERMFLAKNKLNGSIPKEIFIMTLFGLDLSYNHLIGSIPIEVGKLINIEYFEISGNKLSGQIPASLGSCVRLEYLFLSGNVIQGTIPQSLSSLRGIQIIELSQNNLSGKIPKYFESFQALEFLNLSFNNFEGELPTEGVFKNASKFSVTGNSKLCGGIPELKLPRCKSNKKLSHKMKLFIIVTSVVIGIISILSFVALFVWSRKKKSVPTPTLWKPSGLQVSYYDLFRATNGFSSSNLIGCGGFGSVYKGIFNEGEMVVAVKVFNLQYTATFKSFKAECETLRNIRHRNLVRPLSVCSSIDSQGNEFLALVYEFMENGSLEDWLYPTNGSYQGCLNLMQRLNIAIEVANALEYLHNRCHIKIVHCDLKPSNILLDDDMTAHVGDFGLARFIHETPKRFSSENSSSIGLKGSIGYAAPEYGMGSEVSTEGDIYSYGILLLEMFIGKRPTDAIFKDGLDLHNFALMGLSEGISKVLDPIILEIEFGETIGNNDSQETHKFLVSVIQIGVECSVSHPKERKDIGLLVAELSSIKRTFLKDRRTSTVRGNIVQRTRIPPS